MEPAIYLSGEAGLVAEGVWGNILALLGGRKVVGDPIWSRSRNRGALERDILLFSTLRDKAMFMIRF